jgi:DHA1 family tetracycline resistance protein-like MFS transporter
MKPSKNPILAVFITVFIDMLGIGIIIPIFAPLIIRNDYGIIDPITTEATRNIIYGVLAATFPIFQFFGAPILGSLADKYGRKKFFDFRFWALL